MKDLGFTCYSPVSIPEQPTLAELIANLTVQERVDILEGFTEKVLPRRLSRYIREKYDRPFIPKIAVVRRLYKGIDAIEERARSLMRGEVLVTPAEIDPQTGEVITPAIYNDPPKTGGELLTQVQDYFTEDFTPQQVEAVLTKMVEQSKCGGTGTWQFYKEEVVK